jgi:nucleotide-binding universal stress UspA family protein
MRTNDIVVGVDGSAAGLATVDWAAREASRRGAPLRVVLAYEWAWPGAQFKPTPPVEKVAREHAEATVAAAAAHAHAAAPEVDVTSEAVRGRPAQTLIDAARDAALLAVGGRGHGGFVGLLLGSVSLQVATHAETPVVVVRGRSEPNDGPVVVGVDGSVGTEHTLQVAFDAAAARGCGLVAVQAYEYPTAWSGYGVGPQFNDPDELEAETRKALVDSVAPWREKYSDIHVETLVASGGAADVLTGVSETAQLVVVGTRGHGGFAGLLLGSVGQKLLHHAHCPVLIAR